MPVAKHISQLIFVYQTSVGTGFFVIGESKLAFQITAVHIIKSCHNIWPMGLLSNTSNGGCACTGNAGNVFLAIWGKQSRHASRHVRHARAVMHAGVSLTRDFLWIRRRGKRWRHSRRMRNLQFYASCKRPIIRITAGRSGKYFITHKWAKTSWIDANYMSKKGNVKGIEEWLRKYQ